MALTMASSSFESWVLGSSPWWPASKHPGEPHRALYRCPPMPIRLPWWRRWVDDDLKHCHGSASYVARQNLDGDRAPELRLVARGGMAAPTGSDHPDPLSDTCVLLPQVRNNLGHLCGIF